MLWRIGWRLGIGDGGGQNGVSMWGRNGGAAEWKLGNEWLASGLRALRGSEVVQW